MKGHIAAMAKRLVRALAMIPGAEAAGPAAAREARRNAALQHALATSEEENRRLRARKVCVLWVGGGLGWDV